MAVTGFALLTSLLINSAVCLATFVIFSILRINAKTRRFFMPRRFDPDVKRKPRRLPLGLFSWIPKVLFYPESEVMEVAGMDVAVFLRLLYFGWMLFAFCTLWCCTFLIPINATAGFLEGKVAASKFGESGPPAPSPPPPANGFNFSAGPPEPPVPQFTDLDLLSSSNVPPGSPRFWAHLISTYVVTFAALALLYFFSKDVARLRAKFIATMPRGGPANTVLVTDIPGIDYGTISAKADRIVPHQVKQGVEDAYKAGVGAASSVATGTQERVMGANLAESPGPLPEVPEEVLDPWTDAVTQLRKGASVPDMVEREAKLVYGDTHVLAVNACLNTDRLDPLLAKYENTKRQLTDITDDYLGKLRRRVEIKKRKKATLLPAMAPAWAKEKYNVSTKPVSVDALDYLPELLSHIKADIDAERSKAQEAGYLPAAFITFSDRYSQTVAASTMHSHDESMWRMQGAPGPDEIVWRNLRLRQWQRVVRNLVVWLLFVAILVFYLPVTAAIQAVVNLDNASKVPGLNVITRIPFVTQVLQGILPGLVLKIFLAILPPILHVMNKYSGLVSISLIDFATVEKYFIFQVVATFVYQLFAGAALSNLAPLVADPKSALDYIGISAPQQANFFMSFIMINALAVGMGLLRIVPLILYIIQDKLAGTERAKYRLWAKQPLLFGPTLANHTITILLGLAFCNLSPLIAPFCLLYFTAALLAVKFQLIYVYERPYEASGRMWFECFNQIIVGMFTMVVLVMACLLIKGFGLALLLLPLLLLILVFKNTMLTLYTRPWTLMSLKEAAVLDGMDGGAKLSEGEAASIRAIYRAPPFKLDEEEHERVLHDAAAVNTRMATGGSGGGAELSPDMALTRDESTE